MRRLCPLLLCLLTLPVAAQICQPGASPRSPDSAFALNDNGTAVHLEHRLMWMRCALGQRWDSGRCTGRADNLTWDQAVMAATSHSFAGHDDWRLPTLRELNSILEQTCRSPAINLTVFPGASTSWVWTATNYAYDSRMKWSIYFDQGYHDYTGPYHPSHVRLVRGLGEDR